MYWFNISNMSTSMESPQQNHIEEKEMITGSAILLADGRVFTGQKPHDEILSDIFHELEKNGESQTLLTDREDGFTTSIRRFVSREDAARIAFESGQIKKRLLKLYGEDFSRE